MPDDPNKTVLPFVKAPEKQTFVERDQANLVTNARTSVTSTKMSENNELEGACHRSIKGVSASVTVTENGKPKTRGRPGGTVSEYEATVSEEQWKRDVATMTKTQLRRAYPGTAIACNGMLYDRPAKEGAIIDPDVGDLAKLMKAIGPRRHANMTIERIDTNDAAYAFGKIKWENKAGQANNRPNNSHVRNPRTNAWGTVAQVATQVGKKPNTITRALRRALDKEPDEGKHEAIRSRIVAECLLRDAEGKGQTQEDQAAAVEPTPKPDYDQTDDPNAQWALPVTREKRTALNAAYAKARPMEQIERRAENAYGHFTERPYVPVTRYDFSLRMMRRQRHEAQERFDRYQAIYDAGYPLQPDEIEDQDQAQAKVARLDRQIAAAEAARPAFLERLEAYNAANGRPLTPWEIEDARRVADAKKADERYGAREHRTYRDYEDEAMKAAEEFGHE